MSIIYGGTNRKNAIINGNMNHWQRGTTFTSITTGAYSVDRFKYEKVGTAVHDITQDSSVPASINANHSTKIDCTTIDSSITTLDYSNFYQRIEGYNFLPYVGKTATLSYWIKSTKTGTMCVAFMNSVSDRSYVVETTINSANTWEKKTITLTFDYSGGTWNYTNGIGVAVTWILSAGATYQTTAEVWQSGWYMATSNQTNFTDNIANNVFITQVQLELGSEATEFEHKKITEELADCQRYYEKIGGFDNSIQCRNSNANGDLGMTIFHIEKRDTPTRTVVGTWTSANCNAPTIAAQNSKNSFFMASASGSGDAYFADVDSTTYITIDAEL